MAGRRWFVSAGASLTAALTGNKARVVMTENNQSALFERFELDGSMSLSVNSNRKLKNIIVKMFVLADLDESYTCL